MKIKNNQGFSLIEIAVVVMIMGLILGSLLGPLSKQTEISKFKETRVQLEEINEAILGYAAANGFIPCPASATSNGLETRDGNNDCANPTGYVPYQILGLQAARDTSGVMLDVFNNRINYTVSARNDTNSIAGSDQNIRDFTVKGTTESLDNVPPSILAMSPSGTTICEIGGTLQSNNRPCVRQNLTVCNATTCNDVVAGNVIAVNIPFMLHSPGKYLNQSAAESENTDGDNYFIDARVTEGSFEEVLVWSSANTLFSKMISGGQTLAVTP